MKIYNLMGSMLVIVGAMSLSGCAQMEQDWIQDNCNATAAYADGINEGMTPDVSMSTNFASSCPSDQDAINAAYQKGFAQGLKGRAAQVQQETNNVSTSSNSGNIFSGL